MNLGLREWWSGKSGGDKIVWAIVVLSVGAWLFGGLR